MTTLNPKRALRIASVVLVLTALAGCGSDDESASTTRWTPSAAVTASAPVADDPAGAFMSVWGPSSDRVYAVGGQPASLDGGARMVRMFDGAEWSDVPVPDGPMLNWVHGADGVVWMVGEGGLGLRSDGGAFEPVDLPTDAPLWGVWAASASEAWAVGGDARDADASPVILHFDNGTWTAVPVPALDRDGVSALFKVWGTGPDHVFAIGQRGVILHYDGTTWTQLPSGTGDDLVSLWGRGPDDIVAVGGRSIAVVGRWDGTAWTFESLGRVSGLNGSWMAEDGTVLVGGVGGRVLRLPAGEFTFTDVETPTRNSIHAVWGSPDGPGFAVGGTLLRNPPYLGDVLEIR